MKDLLPASEQGESGGDATAAIDSTVKSPQFKQAMAMFSRFDVTDDFFSFVRFLVKITPVKFVTGCQAGPILIGNKDTVEFHCLNYWLTDTLSVVEKQTLEN